MHPYKKKGIVEEKLNQEQLEKLQIISDSKKNTSVEKEIQKAINQFIRRELRKIDKKEINNQGLINTCRQIFLENYLEYSGTNNEYFWKPVDSRNLEYLIDSIKFTLKSKGRSENDEDVINAFDHITSHLPNWFRINSFSITGIYSRYNDIIRQIIYEGNNQSSTSSQSQSIRDWASKQSV